MSATNIVKPEYELPAMALNYLRHLGHFVRAIVKASDLGPSSAPTNVCKIPVGCVLTGVAVVPVVNNIALTESADVKITLGTTASAKQSVSGNFYLLDATNDAKDTAKVFYSNALNPSVTISSSTATVAAGAAVAEVAEKYVTAYLTDSGSKVGDSEVEILAFVQPLVFNEAYIH